MSYEYSSALSWREGDSIIMMVYSKLSERMKVEGEFIKVDSRRAQTVPLHSYIRDSFFSWPPVTFTTCEELSCQQISKVGRKMCVFYAKMGTNGIGGLQSFGLHCIWLLFFFQVKDVLLWCFWWTCWPQSIAVCCRALAQEYYAQVTKRLMVNTWLMIVLSLFLNCYYFSVCN